MKYLMLEFRGVIDLTSQQSLYNKVFMRSTLVGSPSLTKGFSASQKSLVLGTNGLPSVVFQSSVFHFSVVLKLVMIF